MCIEFILALFYLLTILIINFFLFQWIKKYFYKNSFLLRIQFIQKFFTTEQFTPFFILFQFFKNETLPETIFFPIKEFSSKKDLLILGACYQQFQKKARINSSFYYYWKLLEIQYF